MTAALLLFPREFVVHLAIGIEELNHRIAFGIDAQHHGTSALEQISLFR
jgi:hypothetical protein